MFLNDQTITEPKGKSDFNAAEHFKKIIRPKYKMYVFETAYKMFHAFGLHRITLTNQYT